MDNSEKEMDSDTRDCEKVLDTDTDTDTDSDDTDDTEIVLTAGSVPYTARIPY